MAGTNPSTFCVACLSKDEPIDIANNFECRKCNGSMHYECWVEYGENLCPECLSLRERELVEILSDFHKRSSIDKEVLCASTFCDFNLDPNNTRMFGEIQLFQNELFVICRKAGEPWAQ